MSFNYYLEGLLGIRKRKLDISSVTNTKDTGSSSHSSGVSSVFNESKGSMDSSDRNQQCQIVVASSVSSSAVACMSSSIEIDKIEAYHPNCTTRERSIKFTT